MEKPGESSASSAAGRPAGPFRRLVATLLDMVVFCSLCAAIALPVAKTVDWSELPSNLDELTRVLGDPSWIGRASGVVGMCVALWWCYFVVGWGLLGATPGKWIAGLRVVDHRGRAPIGVTRAVLRLFAYSVSSLTFGIGHIMLVFRADRCALHDLLAGTRVVCRPRRRSSTRSAAPADSEHIESRSSPP
jgi:uncharacterized RDD family membrane protein YckC